MSKKPTKNFNSVLESKTQSTSLISSTPEEKLHARFLRLDGTRTSKLMRARNCAFLTIPSLLPPVGWSEQQALPQPYSSIGARGVTSLASRMLSALLPVNDTPFFKLALKSGVEPTPEIQAYLDLMTFQVYRKLTSNNLRETVFQSIQSLIVLGDSLIHLEDDGQFSTTRLDNYVCTRAVDGTVKEIIYIEYEIGENNKNNSTAFNQEKPGYEKFYCQLKNKETYWEYNKETASGENINSGKYSVIPCAILRWYGIAGENYGRSHCEDIFSDLQSLDSYTKALLDGMAAATTFWLCLDPAGITEIDDVSTQANGSWVPARKEDVYVLSPSQTMNPQLQAAQLAVDTMRREIGQSFMMTASSIPSGDRVTATAVRMIGSELETILGGAFSAIARELMEPIIKRTIFLMIENEELDQEMHDQFFEEDGSLSVEVVTGLQALSRDSNLQKLVQMGEMVRNLPKEAIATFKWSEYSKALITSLGFDYRNWIITEEEIRQNEETSRMEQAQQAQLAGQQEALNQVMASAGTAAATQDIQNNNGEGVANVLQNAGIDINSFR